MKRAARLADLRVDGRDALSFATTDPSMLDWHDVNGWVAYVDTGSAWVGATGPVASLSVRARVAERFVAAAWREGKRATFFATELGSTRSLACMLIGEQPVFRAGAWLGALREHPRLREQLRRARAKGVRVRRVDARQLRPGTLLRADLERLCDAWLASRAMEPMGFLVSLEPFSFSDEHAYFVAERDGDVVEFASVVPIYARNGWLVRDVIRSPRAPNGTTELLFATILGDLADADLVTLGLTPLSGPVSPWLRIVSALARPLFDFRGLRAFRERLHPTRWEPVWMLYPARGSAVVHLLDALRAFARGSLVRFGALTFLRHPSSTPFVLAMPLVPWTCVLLALALVRHASLLGFSSGVLFGWVSFDALMLVALFRAALRPVPSMLALTACIAALDAIASVAHVSNVGLGVTFFEGLLRSFATAAPCCAAVLLGAASVRATRRFKMDATGSKRHAVS